MRRWILYGAAVTLLLFLAPIPKTDIGDLIPVEVLRVSADEAGVRVDTDTGDWGRGTDLAGALNHLKETAPGRIFLETADFLIITKETEPLLPELYGILRPATEVCLGENAEADCGKYLAAHKPGVTLNEIRSGLGKIPILYRTGERYRLESREER